MKKKIILLNVFFLLSAPVWAQNIFKAAQLNDITGIKYLLNYGINIDDKDAQGNTPLIIAVKNGQKRAANFLLEKDADIDIQNKAGNTALMAACINGDQEEVALLIEHHANLDIQNANGATALITAVKADNVAAVKQLLESGANANLSDHQHKLAADYARQLKHTEIINLLSGNIPAYLHES